MYDRILVIVDGSPVSDRALEEAIKLTSLDDGKLYVITIIDGPLRHFPDYAVYYNPEPLRGAALKAVDDVLTKVHEEVKASSVEGAIFDCVCQERISEEIAERVELKAQASNANMVVIGTRGRHGMRHLILGSAAEGLICVASRLVLLIHDK